MASSRGSQQLKRALGARMRSARKAAELSIKELAARLGVRPGTLVSWESGQRQPSVHQLALLAEACGADVAWLVTGRAQEASVHHQLARLAEEVAALRAALDRRAAEPAPPYPDPDALAEEVVDEALQTAPPSSPADLRRALASALRRRLGPAIG